MALHTPEWWESDVFANLALASFIMLLIFLPSICFDDTPKRRPHLE